MFERKLEIFLRDKNGVRRVFVYRRWMFLAALAGLVALAAVGAQLWRYRADLPAVSLRRQTALATLTERKAVALALRERVRRLNEATARMAGFDRKLAVMVEAAREAPAGVGAPAPADRLAGAAFDQDIGRRLFDFLETLGNRMAVEEALQQRLSRLLLERKLEFLAKPSLWPAHGFITSGFGSRPSPFGRGGDFHNGVDIKLPLGSPVYAAGAGRVTDVGFVTGYGLRVVVSHDYGLETVYAHLQSADVKPGQPVRRGQRIALSGNSGRTTGPHLHYEVRALGRPVNPRQYLLD